MRADRGHVEGDGSGSGNMQLELVPIGPVGRRFWFNSNPRNRWLDLISVPPATVPARINSSNRIVIGTKCEGGLQNIDNTWHVTDKIKSAVDHRHVLTLPLLCTQFPFRHFLFLPLLLFFLINSIVDGIHR